MLLMLRTYAARPCLRARALHVAALRRDGNPIDWNPRICWHVPLCFDIDHTTKTIPARGVSDCRLRRGGDPWLVVREHPEAVSADHRCT